MRPERAPYRAPSGLFPSGGPLRPIYREPHPVRAGQVTLGAVAGTLWMTLFALLASGARSYVWWTVIAALLGWPVAAVLLRFGDRGAAVGAAAATGFGLAVAGLLVAVRWLGGEWLLW